MSLDNTPACSTTPLSCVARQLIPHSSSSLSQLSTPRICLITILVIILAAHYVRSPWRRVPPGPRGLPVLGNALQLKDKGWMFKKDCKQKFGVFRFHFSCTVIHQVYERNPRTHDVPKCPWPVRYRSQ